MPLLRFALTTVATLVGLVTVFPLETIAQTTTPSALRRSFTLQSSQPKPRLTIAADFASVTPITLWATYYYVHQAQTVANGFPLLDAANNPLGPRLSRRDWCYAALQGTVVVPDDRGVPITYNFTGRGSRSQVNCSGFFSSLSASTVQAMGRARFVLASAPYGYGTDGLKLVPFRTIAVDRNRIPIGSVVYIPEARGITVSLPTGEPFVHDGYFYAADVGSAVRGNHIDVFIGTAKQNPFNFVTSRPSGTFRAYLVRSSEITQTLRALHQKSPR